MKLHSFLALAALLCCTPLVLLSAPVREGSHDRSESPYFIVEGPGGKTIESFPLKSTRVAATVAGIIADVHVTQVYANAGATPVEATYVFPGSTQAAVYGMEMTIGARVVKAKVRTRDEARQEYEQARSAGQNASLLEQHRPNVFQMHVANIMPGDAVKVDLYYTESLTPTAGVYEFVYPSVVGPRYAGAASEPAKDWVKNPYLGEGTPSPASFELKVDLLSGIPLKEVKCVSHRVEPRFEDASRAVVEWTGGTDPGNDRDFILRYRLAAERIESGLLLSQGEKENFFLLTVQPPRRGAPVALPPREYLFVLDVSGSMGGFPLATAEELIGKLLSTLQPRDTFNVVLFASDSTILSPASVPATPENIARAMQTIRRSGAGGGTELETALERALKLPKQSGTARSVVVITDGLITAEPSVLELVRANVDQANLFAFGIGSSVNRYLIEGLARAGQGEPFVVTHPEEARDQAAKFREYIGAPLLTGAEVKFEGLETYDVEPEHVADLLAARPVTVFGKWRGNPQGKIVLSGQTATGAYRQEVPVQNARWVEGSKALSYLWAHRRIERLADREKLRGNKEAKHEITSLGLTYNLLTSHTSFLAVDETVRNPNGQAKTVPQPLPLPQGVSQTAVGNGMATTPEPSATMLAIMTLALLGFLRLRPRSKACAH